MTFLLSRCLNSPFTGYIAALLIGLFVTFISYAFNPSFYFWNDGQTYFYPVLIEIGRNLREGHLPTLILGTFTGGNLIIDWEFGLLNPVTMLICRLLAGARDLYIASLFVSGFYLTMMTLGAYRLGRSFGLSTGFALIATSTLATNNYIVYFYAGAWLSGLVSWCWFLWCWSFLQEYRNRQRNWALLGYVFFGYLCLTSGWPHTSIMLGILTLAYGIEIYTTVSPPAPVIIRLFFHALGLGLLASPHLLPAFLSFSWTNRAVGFFNHNFFAPNLADVLHGSTLFYLPHMRVYNWEAPMMPLTYLAWFAAPLAPLMRWEAAARIWRHRWALLILAAGALLILFGPENFGPLRCPLRGLPYFQAAFLMAFLLPASEQTWCVTRPRLARSLAIVFYSGLMSVFSRPEYMALALCGVFLTGILTYVSFSFLKAGRSRFLAPWIIFGVLACFVTTHALYSSNLELASPGLPHLLESPDKSPPAFPGYSAYLGPAPSASEKDWGREMFFASTGLYHQFYTLNGYTSLSHRTFGPQITGDTWGVIDSADQINRLFAVEPETGARLIDLLAVNSLVVDTQHTSSLVTPLLDPAWTKKYQGVYGTGWQREIQPDFRPTTVSWTSPLITVTPLNAPRGTSEQFDVKSDRTTPGLLVFARLWWPGYQANLDAQPLAVKPLDDLLVSVEIPPQAQGRLSLYFIPPGWPYAWLLFALGLVVIAGAQWPSRRRNLGKSPQSC